MFVFNQDEFDLGILNLGNYVSLCFKSYAPGPGTLLFKPNPFLNYFPSVKDL